MCKTHPGNRCPSDGSAHRSFRRLATKYCGPGHEGQDQLELLPQVFREGKRAGIVAEAGTNPHALVHRAVLRGGTIHAVRALTSNAAVNPETAALAQERLAELEAQALVSQAKRNATAAARRGVNDGAVVEPGVVVPVVAAPVLSELEAANEALNQAEDDRYALYEALEESPEDQDLAMAYREAEAVARAAEEAYRAAAAGVGKAKAAPVAVVEAPVVEEAPVAKAPNVEEAPTTGDEHIALQQAEKDAWEDLQASRDARDALVGKLARSKARMRKTGSWDTPENEAKRAAQDQAYQDATDEIDAADEVRRASAKAAKASTWVPGPIKPYVERVITPPQAEAQTPAEEQAAEASRPERNAAVRAQNKAYERHDEFEAKATNASRTHARSLASMKAAGTEGTPANQAKLAVKAREMEIAELEHRAAVADRGAADATYEAVSLRQAWTPGTPAARKEAKFTPTRNQEESFIHAAHLGEVIAPEREAQAKKLWAQAEALKAAPAAKAPVAVAPVAPEVPVAVAVAKAPKAEAPVEAEAEAAKAPEVPVAVALGALTPKADRKAKVAALRAAALAKGAKIAAPLSAQAAKIADEAKLVSDRAADLAKNQEIVRKNEARKAAADAKKVAKKPAKAPKVKAAAPQAAAAPKVSPTPVRTAPVSQAYPAAPTGILSAQFAEKIASANANSRASEVRRKKAQADAYDRSQAKA